MILTGAVSVWVLFRWVGIPTAGAPSSEAAAAVEEMEKEGVGEAGIRVQANKTKDGGVGTSTISAICWLVRLPKSIKAG